MALDATGRLRVRFALCRLFSATQWAGLSKSDIDAAVDAADEWADGAAASYNSALPQPFRSNVNAAGKAILLAYVCMRRAGVLKVDEDHG